MNPSFNNDHILRRVDQHIAHFDVSRVIVDIDWYAIVPKLTYSLLKKYGYRSPYTSSVSNYDRYLHSLLKEIGEEFNDTVITEVKVGGF